MSQSANDIQHGGNHYKQFKGMEPWDVITGWGLGYLDGTALKYIARWKHKNGVEDLKKAIHFLQKAVEVEEAKGYFSPGAVVTGKVTDSWKELEAAHRAMLAEGDKVRMEDYGYRKVYKEDPTG